MTRWQLLALLGAAFCVGAIAVQFAPDIPSATAQDETTPDDSIQADRADDPTDAPPSTTADSRPSEANPDSDYTEAQPVTSDGGRLVCKLFLVDLNNATAMDTSDRTTEVGQWVGDQVDAGMMLHGVDFEVGQKSTGYPQGYLSVCVYPG